MITRIGGVITWTRGVITRIGGVITRTRGVITHIGGVTDAWVQGQIFLDMISLFVLMDIVQKVFSRD